MVKYTHFNYNKSDQSKTLINVTYFTRFRYTITSNENVPMWPNVAILEIQKWQKKNIFSLITKAFSGLHAVVSFNRVEVR